MLLSDVCLSVAHIGPNSRTERPRKTKIGTEVAHVTRDSDTSFKVKTSKVNLLGAVAYCGGLQHSLLLLLETREREREREITFFAKQAHQKVNRPSTLAPMKQYTMKKSAQRDANTARWL